LLENRVERNKTMKILASVLALGLMAAPAWAATQSFNDVSVIDVSCSKKAAANADAHTKECALACEKSGYGILTEDQKFLKFDAKGNAEILKELKASDKTDHLRVDVKGDVEGDTLRVESVKLL
jgi:hypothetical protein